MTDTYAYYAQKEPNRLAIQDERERITYSEWHQRVQQAASWINRHAIDRKRVAFLLSNCTSFLQVFAGAAAAGVTAIPLDPRWSQAECLEKLTLSGADLVIVEERYMKKIENIQIPSYLLPDWQHEVRCEQTNDAFPFVTDRNPMFYMGFTSGSTGSPKAFVRGQQSWMESFRMTAAAFGISEHDHVLILGTLLSSHFLYGAISTLYFGGSVTLLEKFSTEKVKLMLQENDITALYTVPTMTQALLSNRSLYDRPFKMISTGAEWSQASKEKLKSTYPMITFYDFYGTSELSFVSYLSSNDNHVTSESVGKPFPNVSISIKREDGSDCGPNETGRIYVNSPMRFSSYLHEKQKADEWLTVYDMGYIDQEGYLYMKGRENGMIVYGGLNIFPEEIERVLNVQPEVNRSLVIGMKDAYWGEIPVAVIEGNCQVNQLKQACKAVISPYKIPKKWVMTEKMIETSGGKIARAKMKDWVKEQLTWRQ
ncbi:AMP-binding protein [Bacillus pumilus]|nr:AMP-binding protein [Bacillus pumilus]